MGLNEVPQSLWGIDIFRILTYLTHEQCVISTEDCDEDVCVFLSSPVCVCVSVL